MSTQMIGILWHMLEGHPQGRGNQVRDPSQGWQVPRGCPRHTRRPRTRQPHPRTPVPGTARRLHRRGDDLRAVILPPEERGWVPFSPHRVEHQASDELRVEESALGGRPVARSWTDQSSRDSTDRYQSALTIPLDGRLESTPGEGAPDLEYEVSP